MNTKYLSFLFIIPNRHFNAAYKITVPFEINVHYSLHWNKKVDVLTLGIKPGMAKMINDWERLEQEIQDAAENNSKQYRVPGEYGGGHVRQEGVNAYEDINRQWQQEIHAKEQNDW